MRRIIQTVFQVLALPLVLLYMPAWFVGIAFQVVSIGIRDGRAQVDR